MKQIKLEKAQILLNAMGEIDDAYLNEALLYSPAAKKSKLLPFASPRVRVISSVAAVAAVAALVLAGPMRGMLKKSNDRVENEASNATEQSPIPSAATLDALLASCAQSEKFQMVSHGDIDFFDGNVRLAVQRLDTQEIYLSQPLTYAQQASAHQALSYGGQAYSETSDDGNYAVWITLGNGLVATPYLTPSAGNVSAAVLFRYEAEQLPTQEFFRLLETLTS